MGRHIAKRIVLTGTLHAIDALSVGALRDNATSDIAFARDGRLRPYLPGTGITGPISHWVEEVLGAEAARTMFGRAPRGAENADGWASYWIAEDLVVSGGDRSMVFSDARDGIRIDRHLGVAEPGKKYTRTVLAPGTTFDFCAHADVPLDSRLARDIEEIFAHIVGALCEEGEIRCGGDRSRGLGRVRLLDPALHYDDWSTTAGVLRMLRDERLPYRATSVNRLWRSRVDVELMWACNGPLMVKAPYVGDPVNLVPLLAHDAKGDLVPLLPGSSVKGALRAGAERIVRTLLGTSAGSRLPALVTRLFGEAYDSDSDGIGAQGRLAVSDCYSEASVSAEELPGVRQDVESAIAFHSPLDRWTCAPANLFNAVEPHFSWAPMSMTLFDRGAEDDLAMLGLLLLVLQDVMEHRVPFGFGANRGYGDVLVKTITLTIHGKLAASLGVSPGESLSFEQLLRNETVLRAWSDCITEAAS